MITHISFIAIVVLLQLKSVLLNPVDPVDEVTVLANSTAVLPCSSSETNSQALIVLWYRGNHAEPFYSYDLRNQGHKRQWSDESSLGRRVMLDSREFPLSLRIQPVKPSDEGSFRCRVDFREGPSKEETVTLRVIVLPRVPVITDEDGNIVKETVGPYLEGGRVVLTCKTMGGRPLPKLTWLHDGRLIEDSSNGDDRGQVRNLLHLQHLSRDFLDGQLTCRATNNILSKPLETSVTINMTLAPLTISLRKADGSNLYVREGQTESIQCITEGSRPDPQITWWRDRVQLYSRHIKVERKFNQSVSTLSFVPKMSDHGITLTCRVENPLIPASVLEKSLKLDIQYPPKVRLKLGLGLQNRAVREGSDLYLECDIRSNPDPHEIEWTQEGEVIRHNVSGGVLISNRTLVLQNVGKKNAGQYKCEAINNHGSGFSNILRVHILYSPICSPKTETNIEVAHKATANITCEVDAEPQNVTFQWQFNSSGGIIEIGGERTASIGYKSILPYTPASPGDYGILMCYARNKIGRQQIPCIINVTAAEPPRILKGCKIQNQSSHSLYIECQQIALKNATNFTMEVRRMDDSFLVSSLSNSTPHFMASNLIPGTAYSIRVLASTRNGNSSVVKFRAFTVKTAEKRMGITSKTTSSISTLTPFIISSVVVGIILVIVLIIVIRRTLFPCRRRQQYDSTQSEQDDAQLSLTSTVSFTKPVAHAMSQPDLDNKLYLQELQVPTINQPSYSCAQSSHQIVEPTNPESYVGSSPFRDPLLYSTVLDEHIFSQTYVAEVPKEFQNMPNRSSQD